MLKPTLQWTRQSELGWLKSSGAQVEGIMGSVAVLDQVREDAIPGGMAAGVTRAAGMMQAWARQNAPWRDITGVARASLHGDVQIDGDNFAAGIYGDTVAAPHLFWLHVAHGGRWSIVDRCQAAFAPRMPEIIAGEVSLALSGRGSTWRDTKSGRFI
ncbi:MAG: hypothetical protein VW362_10740 [Candidatus Nanopelagicales bacterium]